MKLANFRLWSILGVDLWSSISILGRCGPPSRDGNESAIVEWCAHLLIGSGSTLAFAMADLPSDPYGELNLDFWKGCGLEANVQIKSA